MKEQVKDKTMYFVYSEDAQSYITTCIGTKELSTFLNRQEWRVKKDLELARRKRKAENKRIKDKNNNLYVVISEKEFKIGG